MKKRRTYKEEVEKLCKAIDISIDAYKTYPPKNWTPEILNMVISNLEKDKLSRIEAEPKFRTLASLKYDIEAVFTYFQEDTGKTVEYFWKKLEDASLEYKRENKLEKILNRGRIRGRIEYEYVTDMIVVAEQVGMTSKEETIKLSDMLEEYESRNKK
ncbi:hypothetical protein MY04_4420 [Flammeovirga sp. MY04]|uniref:hypothetical protein n=1 Tax=Flammeovirga sp. MY04 TaxID=1191459 RepID=UPI00080607FC|nr:hypothetical protein [Flammeovirga sp. MY04]ANQ51758.1 hypothetical protein MY04_4420 [Flammeovirga sp. MY04]